MTVQKVEKYPGAFSFTYEYLRNRLGINGYLYGVVFQPDTRDVVFYCYEAQQDVIVREGEVPPIVLRNGSQR